MATDLIEALSPYGIDYDDALDRFGGNAALYARLACKYLDDTHYVGLVAALDVDDLEEAYTQAHTLKGVAGNLSLRDLYLAAGHVSDALHLGQDARARTYMPQVKQAHERAIKGLEILRDAS